MDGENVHGGDDKRKEMFEARITTHARHVASERVHQHLTIATTAIISRMSLTGDSGEEVRRVKNQGQWTQKSPQQVAFWVDTGPRAQGLEIGLLWRDIVPCCLFMYSRIRVIALLHT